VDRDAKALFVVRDSDEPALVDCTNACPLIAAAEYASDTENPPGVVKLKMRVI